MAERLVECVPNFSEGRDMAVIQEITAAIGRVSGVRLLDVDPGPDTNRTVVTFAGTPEGVKEVAFRAIQRASELIDMSKHAGAHPRMGATDVCPFVPVCGVTMEECVALSIEVARRVGEELAIPVYLYEHSARSPERRSLAAIRHGEYEALPQKLTRPEWKPDFGPARFNARAGATAIGARDFLIAYNINLNTREVKLATDIAFELREKGRSARRGHNGPLYLSGTEILKYREGCYPCGEGDFEGKTIRETIAHCREAHHYDLDEVLRLHDLDPAHPEGESLKKPGRFPHCKAIGWVVGKYDRAQISINLTNYGVTSMHDVLEEARRLAAERGLVVTGSEIVGLVPHPAILDTGKYYLRKQGRSAGVPAQDVLETAIQSLGLRDVADFAPKDRVLGLPKRPEGALAEMKVSGFADEVSRESPAPGGGSVAALAGALGAALASMVSNLTTGKLGADESTATLNQAAEDCQEIKDALLDAIDADADAFASFMKARRLPAGSEAEVKDREEAMRGALRQSVEVPLQTARLSLRVLEIARTVARQGNPNSISDVGVGAQVAFAGVMGGVYNVLINLKDIKDKRDQKDNLVKEEAGFADGARQECREIEKKARAALGIVSDMVEERLK